MPPSRRASSKLSDALIAFVLYAVAAVLFPDVWNTLATVVGVGRGTDLLPCALIVAFLSYLSTSCLRLPALTCAYLRFRGLEFQITQPARRIGLDEVGRSPVQAWAIVDAQVSGPATSNDETNPSA